MKISKELKWTTYTDSDDLAETFQNFWNQRVSSDRLRLQEIYNGFAIIEQVIDTDGVKGDEHHRAEILFTRPPTGDPQIDIAVKIYYVSGWNIYFSGVPAIPESELVDALEGFRQITESKTQAQPEKLTGDRPKPVVRMEGGFSMANKRFDYDGRPNEAIRDIQRFIANLNAYSPTVVDELEIHRTHITLEPFGNDTLKGYERYKLKLTDDSGPDDLGVFMLLPHGNKTTIEFHPMHKGALILWQKLINELPSKDLSPPNETPSNITADIGGNNVLMNIQIDDLPEFHIELGHLESRIELIEDEFFTSSGAPVKHRIKWYKIPNSLYNQYKPAQTNPKRLAYFLSSDIWASDISGISTKIPCALLEFLEVGPNRVKPKVTNGIGLQYYPRVIGPLKHQYVPVLPQFLGWFFENLVPDTVAPGQAGGDGAKVGRYSLFESNPDDYFYQLSVARKIRGFYNQDSKYTWAEAAQQFNWRYGYNQAGLAALRRARKELEKLEGDDPDDRLTLLTEWEATKTT